MDAMMSDQMDTMVTMRQMDENHVMKHAPNDMGLQQLNALNVIAHCCIV